MSDEKPEDEGTPTEVPFLKMLDEFAATGITLCPEYVAQLREQYGQPSFGEMRLTRGMAAEFSLTQQMAYRLFDLGAVLDCPVEVIDATPVDFVEGDDMVDACVVAMRRLVPPKTENINLLITINHDGVVVENQGTDATGKQDIRNLAKGGWPVGTLYGIIHNRSSSVTGKCYCDPALKAMCTLCCKEQAEQWAKGEKE